jgi:hypothetical protein
VANYVKRDANHKAVVDALLAAGVRLLDVSHLPGLGCDIIAEDVKTALPVYLEVKDGTKPPSARRLTESEERLQRIFPKLYFVVLTAEDALRACGIPVGLAPTQGRGEAA